jgi:hypothetical protein
MIALRQDIEWLSLNQITHIINCAGRHCQNNSVIKGMSFLTFDWGEATVQNIIDQTVINAIVGFIEEARQEHGTVLVHGWHSESRPFCLIAIYFMIKYAKKHQDINGTSLKHSNTSTPDGKAPKSMRDSSTSSMHSTPSSQKEG